MNRFVALRGGLFERRGQGMVEYGLILGCIALAVIVAMTGLGVTVKDVLWGSSVSTIIDLFSGLIST